LIRTRTVAVAVLLLACEKQGPAEPAAPTLHVTPVAPAPRPEASNRVTVIGVIRVEQRKVWLERRDGPRLVLSDAPDEILANFDGRTVTLTGERYVPKDQPRGEEHLRPLTWRDDKAAWGGEVIEVGEERTLRGRFVDREHTTRFATGADLWRIHRFENPYGPDVEVEIRARPVTVTPDSNRADAGPKLWVTSVTKAP
jgi:hypothetical protein